MPNRQTTWARTARIRLLAKLGNRCVACGTTSNLSFDCIRPTGSAHHKLNPAGRMTFYSRQILLGNLQILCSRCNSHKRDLENPIYRCTAQAYQQTHAI